MTADELRWYLLRARRMAPAEVVVRGRDRVRQVAWRSRRVRPATIGAGAGPKANSTLRPLRFPTPLDPSAAAAVGSEARADLLAVADKLLTGRWEVLGVTRHDLDDPDWFYDPTTGRRAPHDRYAFNVRFRSESETGNVKQIWELSRHQHLTVLAAAWFASADDRYADAIATQLPSWWRENPFLSGVHWTSGIEVGLRLVAWTWIRRLLDGWGGIHDLFEGNPVAVQQVRWHQEYLSAFRSVGSSANNHAIAEAAGQLVAACAMPWFPESVRWRDAALERFQREAVANTAPSGVNRELASEYHVFVAELLYLAALEAERAGLTVDHATWAAIGRTTDAAAALVDATMQPPRQGDGDDGRALLVDGPDANRWSGLLALGARVFAPQPWWPEAEPTVLATLVGSLASDARRPLDSRPERRPAHFADSGLTLLRTPPDHAASQRELWCRADGGPHGFLSTAAHAHADALSIEVRCGGVEILADPGTYCYHGEPRWRSYFRSTLAHNTVELGHRDQSRSGGPFMWVRHARTRVLAVAEASSGDGEIELWSAEHDGYTALDPPATHRRTIRLDRIARRFDIVDEIDTDGLHPLRMAFHFGPSVDAALGRTTDGAPVIELRWPGASGPAAATLRLPDALVWDIHRGESDPILGWYSPSFGVKGPASMAVGVGTSAAAARRLESALVFHD
jgi:hypothetical protein